MKTVGAAAVAAVVFLVSGVLLLLACAFTLRTAFGVDRYRELHLPVVAYSVGLIGSVALTVVTFRRLRTRD